MDLVRLFIKRISYSQSQNEAFVLILHELESDLKLPIVIGAFEAQAIALELERNLIPPRPLTHDLFKNFAKTFNIKVTEVIIHKLTEGIFHSNLICQHEGREYVIDARTSDAIAIALRFNAPIYTYKHILLKVGLHIPNLNEPSYPDAESSAETIDNDNAMGKSRFGRHTLSELKKMLNDCIENEDYEMAAQIRDEITKRDNS
ncbi:MAG: bifunctional nuclease family protein [Capnocytophaga sp.]|nr:bifunctional nuclease family protein [Capnocytophaga sp.]